MAPTAIAAVGARVEIVFGVASGASRAELDLPRHRGSVAGEAVEVRVRAPQLERRLHRVVEAPDAPGVRRVARLASGTQSRQVDVVFDVARNARELCVPIPGSRVTLFAGDDSVESEQRQPRQVVVEEYVGGPGRLAVAALAVTSELAAMDVVSLVAVVASGFDRRFVHVSHVAALAASVAVSAAQREIRSFVVIEFDRVPRERAVAIAAVVAAPSPMHVVGSVARDAVGGQLLFVELPSVARATASLGVRSFEGKPGLARVVEDRRLPLARRMTRLALRTETSAVGIVDAVAGVAVTGGFFVALPDVTQPARYVAMSTDQGELRLVVIELRLPPPVRRVALAAVLAEAAPMGVVLEVAVDAFARGIAMLRIDLVAQGAVGPCVGPDEVEIGEGVIEGIARQAENVRIPALVIGMAASALGPRNPRKAAVEACALLEVFGHRIVAFETERVLRASVERHVTGSAVGFGFGVCASEFTRHDEPLEIDRVGSFRKRRDGHDGQDDESRPSGPYGSAGCVHGGEKPAHRPSRGAPPGRVSPPPRTT